MSDTFGYNAERKMARPTGHQTITHEDNRKTMGRAFRAAREGDTYVDASGKHWLCQGDFVKPSVYDEGNRAEIHRDAVDTCGNDCKAERDEARGERDELKARILGFAVDMVKQANGIVDRANDLVTSL